MHTCPSGWEKKGNETLLTLNSFQKVLDTGHSAHYTCTRVQAFHRKFNAIASIRSAQTSEGSRAVRVGPVEAPRLLTRAVWMAGLTHTGH